MFRIALLRNSLLVEKIYEEATKTIFRENCHHRCRSLNSTRVPLKVVPSREGAVLILIGVARQGFPSSPHGRTQVVFDVGLAEQLLEDSQDSFVVFGGAFSIAAAPLQGCLSLCDFQRHLADFFRDIGFVANDYNGNAQTTCLHNLVESKENILLTL